MIQGFKYRTITHKNEDGLYRDMESVIKDELYASRFDQLNDPFEAMATQSFGEAIQLLKEVGSDQYGTIQELTHKIIGFRERAGVYSLSKSQCGFPDSELMWAHYADSHKGFCIEYDIEQLALSEELWFNVSCIDQVVYSPTIPKMCLTDILSNTGIQLITKIYGTKSNVWNYENESRLLYETSGIKKYNPASLKAIYFGLNMDSVHEEYLIDKLTNRNIKFFKMKMPNREYKLFPELVAENTQQYKYDLSLDSFEIIMTDHKTAIENFHVFYKGLNTSKDSLLSFIKAFRERYCTRKANVSLYNQNNDYLKVLIKTYPLQGEDLKYMQEHFLAMSMFEIEDELWFNVYN